MNQLAKSVVQEVIDAEHLRLLVFFYYIRAACVAFFSSIFIIHFIFVLFAATHPELFAPKSGVVDPAAVFPFMIFAVILGAVILLGWTFAALTAYAGRCISRREHLTFVCIVAGLECLSVPYGTILGVCTFLVLARPTVKSLFGSTAPVAPMAGQP